MVADRELEASVRRLLKVGAVYRYIERVCRYVFVDAHHLEAFITDLFLVSLWLKPGRVGGGIETGQHQTKRT